MKSLFKGLRGATGLGEQCAKQLHMSRWQEVVRHAIAREQNHIYGVQGQFPTPRCVAGESLRLIAEVLFDVHGPQCAAGPEHRHKAIADLTYDEAVPHGEREQARRRDLACAARGVIVQGVETLPEPVGRDSRPRIVAQLPEDKRHYRVAPERAETGAPQPVGDDDSVSSGVAISLIGANSVRPAGDGEGKGRHQ